jgi:hypothetical protein
MTDCCGFHRLDALSRRKLLRCVAVGGAAAVAASVASRPAHAAEAEVLLLTCMDFRLQNEIAAYMDQRGLRDKYDHIGIAGASLGVLTVLRPDWSRSFWDHLHTAVQLNQIRKVMVLDHLDCDVYRLLLGDDATKDPANELTMHAQRLRLLRGLINQQNANLEVELGVMALDGAVQTVS